MPRKRFLVEEFWSDGDFGALPDSVRLLYASTWGVADDNGILPDRPKDLLMRVWGHQPDRPSLDQVLEWWLSLKSGGYLLPFIGEDGAAYVSIKPIGWDRHQLPINHPSLRHPCPDWVDRGRARVGRMLVAKHKKSHDRVRTNHEESGHIRSNPESSVHKVQGQGQGQISSPDPESRPHAEPSAPSADDVNRAWSAYTPTARKEMGLRPLAGADSLGGNYRLVVAAIHALGSADEVILGLRCLVRKERAEADKQDRTFRRAHYFDPRHAFDPSNLIAAIDWATVERQLPRQDWKAPQ